jgi:hypothetical protein
MSGAIAACPVAVSPKTPKTPWFVDENAIASGQTARYRIGPFSG